MSAETTVAGWLGAWPSTGRQAERAIRGHGAGRLSTEASEGRSGLETQHASPPDGGRSGSVGEQPAAALPDVAAPEDSAHAGQQLASQPAVFSMPRLDRAALSLLDDGALVEQAKVSSEAFGVLYERYVRSVFAFAFSKLRDGGLAEDITSQTFLQALRALPRYEHRGFPIRSWLFRIAANLIADRHRTPIVEQPLRDPRQLPAEAQDQDARAPYDPPDPAAEEAISSWEQAEVFAQLIEDLSPEQRMVVRLRFAEGLAIAEIAARMARSEGAIKMLLLRALQNLRRRLAHGQQDAGGADLRHV